MQAALNPALAQVIGAMDVIKPVTPEGTPTVAAQVMQAAQQATMPQIAQQAGLGGQIQAMRAQQAQQALMQQAMQQRPEAVGIAPMAGPVQMAEGGIVGYAPGGLSEDEMQSFIAPEFGGGIDFIPRESEEEFKKRREEERKAEQERLLEERRRNMDRVVNEGYTRGDIRFPKAAAAPAVSTAPAAPSRAPAAPAAPKAQAPAPMTSTGLFNQAQGRLDQYATEPVSPRAAIQPALEAGAASDEYRRQMGLPTEMERIAQQEAQFKKFYGDRESLIQRRLAEIESQKGLGGLAAFMKGFRQMKGEPIGPGIVRASDSMSFYDTSMRQRAERLEDLRIEVQGLALDRQNALDKMRDDIANGRFASAMKNKEAAQKASNEILLKRAEIDMAQAKVVGGVEEARIRQMQQPSELERLLGRLETLRRTDPAAAEKLAEDIATIRGAGSAARTAMAGQRLSLDQLRALQKTYSEQAENMLLPPAQREQAAQMLKQVNDQIAESAGIKMPTSQSGAPAPGTVMDGYRFKGGNPADQKNWEKV